MSATAALGEGALPHLLDALDLFGVFGVVRVADGHGARRALPDAPLMQRLLHRLVELHLLVVIVKKGKK